MDKLILRDRVFDKDFLSIEEDYGDGVFISIRENFVESDFEDSNFDETAVYLNYESLRSLRNWINELLEEN